MCEGHHDISRREYPPNDGLESLCRHRKRYQTCATTHARHQETLNLQNLELIKIDK